MAKRTWVVAIVVTLVACGLPKDSALCGPNGTNACGAGRVCDPTFGCVECAADADCTGSLPLCLFGTCVECEVDADCGGSTPSCWSDHACHAACPATSCPASMPVCDTGASSDNYQSCVECTKSADCTDPSRPVCNGTLQQCVECVKSADCPSSAPVCFFRDGRCVGCTKSSDCATGKTCDPATLACVD